MASSQESTTAAELQAQSRLAAIEAYRNRPENETGWDRLREMYMVEKGEFSPELQTIPISMRMGALGGMTVGFMKEWVASKDAFVRQNKADTFMSARDYMGRALNHQTLAATRAGLRLCWRIGLFTGFYTWTTMTTAMYTNRLSAREYALSGALSGVLYQMKVGLNGAVVGGLFGGIMSAAVGFLIEMSLKQNNYDFPTIRYDLHLMRLQNWERDQEMQAKREADRLLKEVRKEIDAEGESPAGRL